MTRAQKEENLETTAASAPPATTITNTKTSWADMTEAAEEEAAQNGFVLLSVHALKS